MERSKGRFFISYFTLDELAHLFGSAALSNVWNGELRHYTSNLIAASAGLSQVCHDVSQVKTALGHSSPVSGRAAGGKWLQSAGAPRMPGGSYPEYPSFQAGGSAFRSMIEE